MRAKVKLIFLGALILALTGFSPSPWLGISQEHISWSAIGPVRPCEGRLAGGFAYASFPKPVDSADVQVGADFRVLQSSLGKDTLRSRKLTAVLDLLQGDSIGAAKQLEALAAQQPTNAVTLNDLSVAYLDRAGKARDPLDLLRALAAAEKAVSLDDNLIEAKFNLALSLERLFLDHNALAAWLNYLSVDPTSSWATEARYHVKLLSQPTALQIWKNRKPVLERAALHGDFTRVNNLVRQFRQASRTYAEEVLLGRWAAATIKGDALLASRELKMVRIIGESLALIEHDYMVKNAVAAIDQAAIPTDGAGLQKIAEGHMAFVRGLGYYQDEDIRRARDEFLAAGTLLRSVNSPMAGWAMFYVAVCDYYKLRYRYTFESLLSLETSLSLRLYPALHGRILWMKGLSHFARTNLNDSLGYFHHSLDQFEKLGEQENLSAVSSLLAQSYQYNGQSRKAWLYRYRALAGRRKIITPRRLMTLLYDVADAATEGGYLKIAKLFRDDQVRVALAWGSASAISESLHRRSITMNLLQDFERAAADLRRSEAYANRVFDPGIRERLLADLRLASADLKKRTDPVAAIRELSGAIESFKRTTFALRVPQALLSRAKIYQEEGLLDLAEQDLEAAASIYRDESQGNWTPRLASPIGKDAIEVFRRLVDFRVRARGDTIGAFEAAEEARSRVIWDTLNSADLGLREAKLIRERESKHRALSVSEIQAMLPPGVFLVEYVALPAGFAAWLIHGKEVKMVTLNVDIRRLEKEVDGFRKAILSDASVTDEIGARLFGQLMEPVLELIPYRPGSIYKLIVVPDGVLQQIPVGALKDTRTNKYLIEEFDLGIAPSASLYVSRLESRLPPQPRIISMGASSFQRIKYKWLSSLPGAEEEAGLVAEKYAVSKTLMGPEATPGAFWQSMIDYDIVHFAGHTLVNQDLPLETRLLMDAGEVHGFEFYGRQLGKVRLVVLSSCSSAGGAAGSFQWLAGLSRALLVNGVPAVVATHWAVSDGADSDLILRFHQLVREGRGPVVALSQARREALMGAREARKIRNWARFEVIGDFGK
jgi:CHAT domain-containing protein